VRLGTLAKVLAGGLWENFIPLDITWSYYVDDCMFLVWKHVMGGYLGWVMRMLG